MAIVLRFPNHGRTSAGRRKKASIGTSFPDKSLKRFASPKEASLRRAKILRTCASEHRAAEAISGIVIPFRSAQRSIGCASESTSDMARIISPRNRESQSEIFPREISLRRKELVKWDMAKKTKPEAREIFLGAWLKLFNISTVEAGKIAGCNQSYIVNMSAGRKPNVNVLYLLALSEKMGITVNDLFCRPPAKAQIAHLREYSPQAQAAILGRKTAES